jgi:hypothetical protein
MDDFDRFLEEISDCFIQRDFEPWRNRIVLPFSLITKDGPVLLRTTSRLRENFDQYLVACKALSLDQIVRRPISLEDCKDGTWIGTYETNLLSKGQRAVAPYTSSALLVPVDGILKMHSIMNARGHHDWTGEFPKGPWGSEA